MEPIPLCDSETLSCGIEIQYDKNQGGFVMKQWFVLLSCLAGFSLAGLESHLVASPGRFRHFNAYGNAAAQMVRKDGRESLRVSLGGVGTARSGAVQFTAPAFRNVADGYDGVSVIYRGDGGTGNFVVLLSDGEKNSWCWNGERWKTSAMLPCYNEDWVKKVLLVRDFHYLGPNKENPPVLNLKNVTNLQFAIGMQLNDPSKKHAEFYLYEIAFEKGAKERTVFRTTSVPDPSLRHSGTEQASVRPLSSRNPVETPLSCYALPEWVDWKRENHFQRNTSVRHSISLNNYWQFQVNLDSSVEKLRKHDGKQPGMPDSVQSGGTWIYVKVPGRWDGRYFYLLDREKSRISQIDGLPVSDYAQGWYRRALSIPESWSGCRFLLQFNAIEDQARVFVNGVPVKDISKTGTLDISGQILPGRNNEIALLVQYSSFPLRKSHPKYSEFILPKMGSVWWFGWHDGPGITDDVWLHVLPAELSGNDLRILTSVEKKLLFADAEFFNRSQEDRVLRIRAEVTDQGKTVFSLPERTVVLKAGSSERIGISGKWENPEYWSPENPRLYSLRFTVCDAEGKILDEMSDEFGFRELRVSGGNFYLNGSKIRLLFKSSQFRYTSLSEQGLVNMLTALKKMHFNGIMLETMNERIVKLCNRLGMMVVLRHVMPPLVRMGTYLPGVPNHGYPFEVYLAPKFRRAKLELEETLIGIVRKFRNDPSLVIWAINPLLCWNSEWINPNRIDANQPQNDILKASLMEEEFLRRLDPSRIVLQSMGGSSGSIIAANPYPTFENNPDEWADWPMKWSAVRKKPLVLEEVALPFCFNYANWRNSRTGKDTSWDEKKQMFYEQGARYFGDSIYESSSPHQPDDGWSTGRAGVIRENGIIRNRMDKAMEKTAELWLSRCLSAWRAYDISGIWLFESTVDYFSRTQESEKDLPPAADLTTPGAKADYSAEFSYEYPNRLHAAVSAGQHPFLAFIAGRPGRLSSREHAFYSGQTVEKQIILSNDHLTSVTADIAWKIVCLRDKKELASGQLSGFHLPAGAVRKIPFSWKVTEVKKREHCRIYLNVRYGSESCNDSFDLHLFPQRTVSSGKCFPVLLYDEIGKTRTLLKQMGISFLEISKEQQLPRTSLLVVGAESFSSAFLAKCREWGLEKLLKNGLTMLVLPQNDRGALKDYLEERRCRMVFSKDSIHPILKGIGEEDLRYWRGEPDVLDPYPDLGMSMKNGRFMRWGTEGTVVSFVMDKPCSGRFRVLLDCDADLSRTALLEYFTEKGRVLFCQLDFPSRYGVDPVATLLADRIFAYALKPDPVPQTVPAVISGSKEALTDLGFDFLPESELGSAKLLVLGSGFRIPADQVRRFAEEGGSILAVGLSSREYSLLKLPNPVREKVRLAGYPKGNPMFRGLGNSDFYFNPAVELPVFGQSRIVEDFHAGRGRIMALTILPSDLTEEASRIKLQRILSVLLSSLGAPASARLNFTSDSGDLHLDRLKVPFRTDPESKGEDLGWYLPGVDDSSWEKLEIGSHWEGQGITMKNPNCSPSAGLPYDGDAWYRIPVTIPKSWKGKRLYFDADTIDDFDWVWFNGIPIGHTGAETPKYWSAKRLYRIPDKAIQWGKKNILVVRVRDLRGNGGIIGKVRIGGKKPESDAIFFDRPSRLILNFDPNSWRQW